MKPPILAANPPSGLRQYDMNKKRTTCFSCDTPLSMYSSHKHYCSRECFNLHRTCHSKGMHPREYREMLQQQNNLCYVCHNDLGDNRRRIHIDHSHQTGKVRSILCHSCNVALGMAKESPTRLRQLADYIEQHTSQPAQQPAIEVCVDSQQLAPARI